MTGQSISETTSDPVASGTNADCPNEIDSDDTSSDNDNQPSRPRMRRERNYRRRVYYDTSSMESYDFNQPRSASRNSLFVSLFLIFNIGTFGQLSRMSSYRTKVF